MPISEMMLPEFDQEMANTRKILELVPEDSFGWKPHEKSMALGRLASHVASFPDWTVHAIKLDRLVLGPDTRSLNAGNRAELLHFFDKTLEEAREALAGASDEHLRKVWEMEAGGRTFISMPRVDVLRSIVMNHMIHHRAQLGVYLRLKEIPIPGMYGPSADEARLF